MSILGWNAWLNGKSIGYHPGNASQTSTTALLSFKNITLKDEGNVLTVTTDYTGHDQTSTGPAGAENPRGILGAQLLSGNDTKLSFDEWKIQGNAGGERNIDPVSGFPAQNACKTYTDFVRPLGSRPHE